MTGAFRDQTRHTPGPWQVGRCTAGKSGTSLSIWRNDEGPNDTEAGNTNYMRIAQHVHSEADAILIAAAPDMLAELQRMERRYVALIDSGDCGHWDPNKDEDVIAMRAVINKATHVAPADCERTT